MKIFNINLYTIFNIKVSNNYILKLMIIFKYLNHDFESEFQEKRSINSVTTQSDKYFCLSRFFDKKKPI